MKKFKYFFIFASLFLSSQTSFANDLPEKKLSDRQIIIKNNTYSLIPLAAIGFTQWNWGELSFRATNEGMFGRNTRYGGADKMGHFYSAYLVSDLLSKKFQADGISANKATFYGMMSSIALSTIVEIGDSTAEEHGFSIHDQIMNVFGALSSYVLLNNPELGKKIAFKIDYIPDHNPFKSDGRLVDDYEGTRYIAALRLSGFDFAKNNFLRFVEIQANYSAPGYVDNEPSKSRNLGIGIAINLSEVLDYFYDGKANKYATGFFDYYQPRYTYTNYKKDFND